LNKKDVIVKVAIAVVLGTVGFYSGIYYGIMKTDVYMENLMTEYEKISDEVDAFKKVADPKTIRLYVRELNRILDDTKVLHKIIDTGQMGDEALSEFFSNYDNKLNKVNERLVVLALDTQGMISELSENVTADLRSNKVELESTLKSEADSVKKEIGRLYDRVDELYRELENVSMLVDKAKETFFGKAIFKEEE
jgi:MFS superfamily sulfate permease-like transporter